MKKLSAEARQQSAEARQQTKLIVTRCKSHNIDYKSKLGPEVMKFYGIE